MFNSYLKPMEPKTCPHAFDSDQHIFQVKWDGVRILAFVNKNQVRLQNRKLNDRTFQYPEMQSLSKQITIKEAIFDGEMISLRDGKPSFSRILQRDLVSTTGQRPRFIIPVIYMIFDILYWDGLNLTTLSWEERDHHLKNALIPSEYLQITESIPHQGKAFYQAVKEQKLEGIVAKDLTAPYILGGKTNHWQKIKPRKDMNCVIGGFVIDHENQEIKSLLIGAYQEKKFIYLGKVGSGLTEKTSKELFSLLPSLSITQTHFDPEPKKQKSWQWIKPILTIKVEYMEFTQDRQLRQPTIKGFTKINPKECLLVEE